MKITTHPWLFIALTLLGIAPAWALDDTQGSVPAAATPSHIEPPQPDPATGRDDTTSDVSSPSKTLDREQPIHIKADRIEINQKKSITLYIGRVSFIQGGMRINAARVEASYKGDKIDTIIATGKPVTLYQPSETPGQDLHASALRLEYHALASQADLSGEVRLQQGANLVLCNTLHYDLAESTLTAEGDGADGRVAVTIESAAIEKPAAPNTLPGAQKRKHP